MQTATAGMENKRVTVKCDCGAEYETELVPIGTRDVRRKLQCDACDAARAATAARLPSTGNVAQLDAKWRAICPARYQRVDSSKLPCGPKVASIVESWRPSANGMGIMLVGATRRGKTMCAWNGIRHIMRAGVDVAAVNDATIGVRYGDALGRGEGMDYIDRLVYPELLLWDDFGKAKASDRYAELAYAIIETRMAALRPMIVTTQLEPDDIVDKLGEYNGSAIAERLQECCEVVPV